VGTVVVVIYSVGNGAFMKIVTFTNSYSKTLYIEIIQKKELNEAFHWKVSTKSISNRGSIWGNKVKNRA
jgi:hypothetical protein